MTNYNFARKSVSRFSVSNLRGNFLSIVVACAVCAGLFAFAPAAARANMTYANLAGGNLNFKLTTANSNMISSNDNWSLVTSVQGYCGGNTLAPTAGIDPQTILKTEFNSTGATPTYALPADGSGTCVAANKQNTSAFNTGGIAEFDGADYNNLPAPTIAFQPNGSKTAPYMVFFVSTLGMTNVQFSYVATDVDAGSNDAVSPVALQYRLGNSGLFTNLPGGFIADASAPGTTRLVTTRSLTLPAALNNQSQIQLRLIMADGAGSDEWVGIDNITIGRLAPTAAGVSVGGRLLTTDGRGIRNALISMTDASGKTRTTVSGALGYYSFDDVAAGETYVFTARGKRFSFSQPTQVFNVSENMDNIDFIANPGASEPSRRFGGETVGRAESVRFGK